MFWRSSIFVVPSPECVLRFAIKRSRGCDGRTLVPTRSTLLASIAYMDGGRHRSIEGDGKVSEHYTMIASILQSEQRVVFWSGQMMYHLQTSIP